MAQAPIVATKPVSGGAKDSLAPRSFMHDDFPIIRTASLTLAVSIVVAALLVGGSRFLLVQQIASQAQSQIELRDVQMKFSSATSEKDDIRDFQFKYLRLTEQGFVGDERRLDVVEFVRDIQEKQKFLPINYEIFPQQIVQSDPPVETGELELRGSRVQIKMGLLHEVDLFNFLQEISKKGRFIPQSCSINTVEVDRHLMLAPRQQGQCNLFWITMGQRAVVDPAAPVSGQ